VEKYSLHEECLVVAGDTEDLVLKLGGDWELLGMMKRNQRCVCGHDNAMVLGKRVSAVAGLLAEADKWIDEVEVGEVETVVGNRCKIVTRLNNGELVVVDAAAGRKLGVRIDWT